MAQPHVVQQMSWTRRARPSFLALHRDAAGRASVLTLDRPRRLLQVALGLVWLLDAALQYQPYMFTSDFPMDVIGKTAQDNPGWVAQPVTWAAHLMAHHIVVSNGLFATIQLAIAVGLLYRRTARLALASSVVWALLLWWLGEGLGGVLAGPVSPLAGAPGAAVLYVVVAALVWPRKAAVQPGQSVATASPLGNVGARLGWLALWGSLAFEALRPAVRSPSALHDLVVGGADGEPAWVRAIDNGVGGVLAHHGTAASLVLAVLFAVVAVGVILPRLLRPVLLLAVLLSALIWVVGEDFGAIATGQGTDPNTGPLLALLAATFWPRTGSPAGLPGRPGSANRSGHPAGPVDAGATAG